MATTKKVTPIWENDTLVANSETLVSKVVRLTVGYGAIVNIKIRNGEMDPMTPARVQIEVSSDEVNWYDYRDELVGSLSHAGVESRGGFEIPMAVFFLRLCAHSTDADVYLDADCVEVLVQ